MHGDTVSSLYQLVCVWACVQVTSLKKRIRVEALARWKCTHLPCSTTLRVGTLEGTDSEFLKLPGLVSRKKDFIPALTKAVREGWVPPPAVVAEHKRADMKRSRSMANIAHGSVVIDYSEEPSGKLVRKE